MKINKTIIKTFTWRFIASSITFGLAIIFGIPMKSAGAMVVIAMTLKMLGYYFHEKFWSGKPDSYVIPRPNIISVGELIHRTISSITSPSKKA